MRWWARACVGLIVIYGVMLGVIYVRQEHLMLNFAPVADNHAYAFDTAVEDIWLEREGARLHGVLFRTDAAVPARGLVLYYKGNAGNVGNSSKMARTFLGLGFDVMSMDYRGFGKSRGPLSEDALLADAEAWYDLARERYGQQDIRVVGYSFGSTQASHVAATRPVEDLILFAPMKSILDLGRRRYPWVPTFISRFPLRSDLKLMQAHTARIVIYHGTADAVVPFASGAELKSVIGADDAFVEVAGAGHGDLPWTALVQEDIALRWSGL